MKFPLMPNSGVKSVGTSEFYGGLNLRDSLNDIADNQLTQSVNMWYKDGMLRTRPSVRVDDKAINENSDWSCMGTKAHDIYKDGKQLVTVRMSTANKRAIHFFWCGEVENAIEELTPLILNVDRLDNYLVVQHQNTLYCFADYSIYKLNSGASVWGEVSPQELAPTMFIHCKTADAQGMSGIKTQVLVPNLLTPYYKMVYSTVNVEYESCTMRYPLAYMLKTAPTGETVQPLTITAEHTFKDNDVIKTQVHTAVWDGTGGCREEFAENDAPADGLRMYVNGWYVLFKEYTVSGSEDNANPKVLTESDYIPDNLVITAAYDWEAESKNKVFKMTRAEWFGGASQGINGGTRLFLCGNTNAGEGALLVWSDLNNPLYFPENNCAYVGNTHIPLTAFGKQSDMLVLFKKREIYYTQYMRNDSITAENIDNQDVIDYTAASVYFPLIQIHPTIGCDCPDTIQLCRNRLVWMCSNGKVYTLVTENQYSERNVYEVGGMVERVLGKIGPDPLKAATSCDFDGHYAIAVEWVTTENSVSTGDLKVFLMDYNSSGYQYVSSYQKEEDANIRIPWYLWQFPAEIMDGALLFGFDRFKLAYFNDSKLNVYTAGGESSLDFEQKPIHSEMQTKLFEFGSGMYRKNVNKVRLSLGNNGGVPINVEYITDCGSSGDEVTLDSDETENYTPGYISSVALSPSIRSVLRFGVKLSCEGKMAVGRMTFDYRMLGGVK